MWCRSATHDHLTHFCNIRSADLQNRPHEHNVYTCALTQRVHMCLNTHAYACIKWITSHGSGLVSTVWPGSLSCKQWHDTLSFKQVHPANMSIQHHNVKSAIQALNWQANLMSVADMLCCTAKLVSMQVGLRYYLLGAFWFSCTCILHLDAGLVHSSLRWSQVGVSLAISETVQRTRKAVTLQLAICV